MIISSAVSERMPLCDMAAAPDLRRSVAVKTWTAPPWTCEVLVVDLMPTATAPMGEPDECRLITAGLNADAPEAET